MAPKALERYRIIPRDTYDPTADYLLLDLVYLNGETYLCKAPCKGIAPPNATYWMLISSSASVIDRQAAEAAAQAAAGSADATAASKTAAETARSGAEGARDAAGTAKGGAEDARDEAVTAKTGAETARDEALAYRDQAQQAAANVATIDQLYPVGIIVELGIDTDPSTLWPGTIWAPYGVGRMTVGVDPSDPDFNAAGKTGGSKTHTNTMNEMVIHGHELYLEANGNELRRTLFDAPAGYAFSGLVSGALTNRDKTRSAGLGQPYNIMNPYEVVYRYKRTGTAA